MIIEYMASEKNIVDRILNEDGYRFVAKGEVTEQKIRDWVNIVSERLRREDVVKSMSDIESVIIIQDSKKVLKGNKPHSDMKIISILDYYDDVDITIIYLILNKGERDEFNMKYTVPLILDCETIESLFDRNGEYIGSRRNVEDYMEI